MHILLIEDAPEWADIVVSSVRRMGHTVQWEISVQSGMERLLNNYFDVLITDFLLPDGDMQKQLIHIRQSYPTLGIIVITVQTRIEVVTTSLAEGADYHLIKPFNLETLEAKLTALQRRMFTEVHAPPGSLDWRLSVREHRLVGPNEECLNLTVREAELLAALINSPGTPLNHVRLSNLLRYSDAAFEPHRIDTQIYRLRKKLAQLHGEPFKISNIYARGFVLVHEAKTRCVIEL